MNLVSTIQLSAADVAAALTNHIKAAYPQVVPDVQVTLIEGTTDSYAIAATISQAPAAPAKVKGKRGGRPRKNTVTEVVQEPTVAEVLADPESPVESPYVDVVVEDVADEAPSQDSSLFGEASVVEFDN